MCARIGACLSVVLWSCAACERAPPEEIVSLRPIPTGAQREAHPATPIVAASVAEAASEPVREGAPGLAGRCVHPTPTDPPPQVPAGPAKGCPLDPEGTSSSTRTRVTFSEVGGVEVEAEFVHSPRDTARGLMYRKSMLEDRGMLFDLRSRDDHKFWMHNTCIPLDMLFVDDDGLIVGIVENAPTLNDDPRGVGCPSRYVLEVNAGWSRRHGVKAGQRMTLARPFAGEAASGEK